MEEVPEIFGSFSFGEFLVLALVFGVFGFFIFLVLKILWKISKRLDK